MSKTVKMLDSTSGALFMIGLVTSKLRFLPIPVFSTIIGLVSLGSYLSGYLIWLITCRFYSQYPKMPNAWFGFLPIRQQHLIAASIGLVAITLCLTALSLPILGVAGSWLFAISNLFWAIAEYHRFKNPPPKALNPTYSHQRQAYYLSYATLATMVSIMAALVLTASFFLVASPAIVPLAAVFTLANTFICLAAFYFLYKSLTTQAPQPAVQQNQQDLAAALQPSSSYTPILNNDNAPSLGKAAGIQQLSATNSAQSKIRDFEPSEKILLQDILRTAQGDMALATTPAPVSTITF